MIEAWAAEPEPATGSEPSPPLDAAVVEHANRGVRVQLLLRAFLVVFVVLTIALVPPVQGRAASYAVAAAYAVFAAGFAVWARRGGAPVARWAWLGLYADVVALATLTLIAGVSAERTWTDDVLLHGMFLIPVLAATQLQPGVCTSVVVPTTIVFFVSSVATQAANDEPWASIVLRTLALAAVGAGSIALTRIQRSRVATIGGLVRDRTALLDDLVHVEDRQRQQLAEQLHDGALQYVLAARHDLDDLQDDANHDAVERIDYALVESARLLRAKVTELHPAVLEHAGLPRALRDLGEATGRPDRPVHVDVAGWPEALRTPADPLLFGAARELLSNAMKHAAATSVEVTLSLDGAIARLIVADDGRGIADGRLRQAIDEGHVGLYTQRLRIEAAGGRLTLSTARPAGTEATVELPVPPAPARPT
jgi:two-component system NarL family sensor kinase